MDCTRASFHEAGHMTVALRFDRKVFCAGLVDGKPMAFCFLETELPVPHECFIFLAGGAAGELLCDPPFVPPYDLKAAGRDREMITARRGEDLKTYLDEARSVLESCKKAWAALQGEFLVKLRNAGGGNIISGFMGGQGRTQTLLTGARIEEIWDENKP